MAKSFFAALGVVFPMAVLMCIGACLRVTGVTDRKTMRAVDRISFRLLMPCLLFKNIYSTDLSVEFNAGELLFAVAGILVVFAIAVLIPPKLIEDHNQAASVSQAIVRANYILFGIAVAESIYGEGNTGSIALLGALAVPFTNMLAVIILERNRAGNVPLPRLVISILHNPMVIAALLALGFYCLPFRMPDALWSIVKEIAAITTPLSFISLGVSLDIGELRHNRRPLMTGVILRMIVVPLIFLPLCVLFGFRGTALCALMVLFAAPSAVASYPMAVAMGADGQLAGQLVCATTLVSLGTIFLFTFLFQNFGML